MANTLSFVCSARTLDITVTPIPGSHKVGGGHDDRGGGRIPSARAGYAYAGSVDVVLVQTTGTGKAQTLAELLTLVSPVGEGDITITGTGTLAGIKSYLALVDVSIGGDSVQTASISWKGTGNTVA